MKKKPVISKEAEVLLKLLRIALGTEPRKYFGNVVEPFPEGIDWKEVIKLSYKHKVPALAVDGLKASGYNPYEGLDEKQSEELKAILDPWYASVQSTEWNYCYYVDVLESLCKVFVDNDLAPIILKGYGLSLLYPRPSHRGIGDIDIFLVDKDGKPAAERGDEIIEKSFEIKPVTWRFSHHSTYEYRGLVVENHYRLSEENFCTKHQQKELSLLLESLSQSRLPYLNLGISFPNHTFNAIFLIKHMQCHFSQDNISFRQLCDWKAFVCAYYREINWIEVKKIWNRLGLFPFASAICATAIKYLDLKKEYIPIIAYNDEMADYIIDERINKKWRNKSGIYNFASYYINRRRIYFVTGNHWFIMMMKSVYLHLFHQNEYPFWGY